MGESCRHQSPASISLTLPEEPPDSQASEETATASLPHGKIKGYPHSLYRFTAVVHGEPRREDARPELAFQSGRHTGRAGAPRWAAALAGAEARGRSGGGVGAARPGPHGTAGESRRRRRRCTRSSLGLVPTAETPRLVLHAQPGLLGGGRGGARDGGGGGRRAHHRRRRGRRPGLPHTPLSAPADGEQFPCQDPGKKGDKILTDSCSPRNRGGLAPYPFFMLRRRSPVPLRAGTSPRAPRERRAAGWKPRRALAGAPGRRECRRGRH